MKHRVTAQVNPSFTSCLIANFCCMYPYRTGNSHCLMLFFNLQGQYVEGKTKNCETMEELIVREQETAKAGGYFSYTTCHTNLCNTTFPSKSSAVRTKAKELNCRFIMSTKILETKSISQVFLTTTGIEVSVVHL